MKFDLRYLLLSLLFVFSSALEGCIPCKEAPDTYRGAQINGSYSGYGYTCVSYASRRCDYTLCQYDGCGRDWELTSWYCW